MPGMAAFPSVTFQTSQNPSPVTAPGCSPALREVNGELHHSQSASRENPPAAAALLCRHYCSIRNVRLQLFSAGRDFIVLFFYSLIPESVQDGGAAVPFPGSKDQVEKTGMLTTAVSSSARCKFTVTGHTRRAHEALQ